jgi:hypothetical protein
MTVVGVMANSRTLGLVNPRDFRDLHVIVVRYIQVVETGRYPVFFVGFVFFIANGPKFGSTGELPSPIPREFGLPSGRLIQRLCRFCRDSIYGF